MNYLSATPPPVEIVFVYDVKVKEEASIRKEESNDI
jgi:hypothetical protein